MLLIAVALVAQDETPQAVQITNPPRVENVTSDTAVIAWSTNVSSGTLVRYGTDAQQLTSTAEQPWGALTHRVTIRNLQPGTTYFFQAESNQGRGTGTKAPSNVMSFTTKGHRGAALPQGDSTSAADSVRVVAGPVAQNITEHSARIWWESDRPSDAIVKYGTDAQNLTEIKQKPWGDQAHELELSGLQPGTQYFVAVMNPDGRIRSQGRFKTVVSAQSPVGEGARRYTDIRIIDGPRIEFIGNNSAVIAWTTNAPASGVLRYGTSPDAVGELADAPAQQTTHRVTLHHLLPNATYYFSAESGMAASGVAPFHTVANGAPALRLTKPQ